MSLYEYGHTILTSERGKEMVDEIIGAGLCDDPSKCSVLSFAMSMTATGGIMYGLGSDGAAQDSKFKSQATFTILNGIYHLVIDNNINV